MNEETIREYILDDNSDLDESDDDIFSEVEDDYHDNEDVTMSEVGVPEVGVVDDMEVTREFDTGEVGAHNLTGNLGLDQDQWDVGLDQEKWELGLVQGQDEVGQGDNLGNVGDVGLGLQNLPQPNRLTPTHGIEDMDQSLSDDDVPLAQRLGLARVAGPQAGATRPMHAHGPRPRPVPTMKWKKPSGLQNFVPVIHTFQDIEYGVQPGSGVNDDTSPSVIFKFFFDDELMELIVNETNAFQARVLEDMQNKGILAPKSRIHQWKPLTTDELYTFFAIIMLMGIDRKPTIASYWSTDPKRETPFFGKCMSVNRFLNILTYLHFTGNENDGDKASKIRPVLDHLSRKFKEAYRPGQDVVIDESLMLFKGRLGWKQYIPKKRSRFGLKSFDLCEAVTGYVYSSILYTGKDNQYDDEHMDMFGLSGSVVLRLMKDLLNTGRTLYVDNWYSSPLLFEELYQRKTNTCGTVRLNRKEMPKDIDIKNIKKGDMEVRYSNNVAVVVWKDKRPVSMLTTFHTPQLTLTGKSDRQTGEPILKPNVIQTYNQHMGGVDIVDQVTEAYPSMRKSIKWYKKFFLHELDICLYNTLVMWRCLHAGKTSYLELRERVAAELLEAHHVPLPRHTGGRRSSEETPLRLQGRHFLDLIPPTASKQFPARRCIVCKKHGTRKETRYMCPDCGDVALCVVPCFKTFHTKKEF